MRGKLSKMWTQDRRMRCVIFFNSDDNRVLADFLLKTEVHNLFYLN